MTDPWDPPIFRGGGVEVKLAEKAEKEYSKMSQENKANMVLPWNLSKSDSKGIEQLCQMMRTDQIK